jgi:ATP-dependent DNA helicase RecQ
MMIESPEHILKKFWGYDQFRPMQAEIIQDVLAGKDTLALLPTGGGKSICFQVPALAKPGICIVISPLIALMKDQVYNLQKRGIKAAAIFSGMSRREIDITLDNCILGDIKLLYVSPERLQTDIAIARIRQMNVNLFAIDEAHCISQWGYDFRPAYLKIADLRELHSQVPFLALTATATPRVVIDIQEKLGFAQKNVLQKSFARENLAYIVLREPNKRNKLLEILRKIKGCGIVYANTRRFTKEVAYFLQQHGISADYYHAGLDKEERSRKQDNWMQGRTRIVVATNAFGMGIDNPHVRIVVHLQPPSGLEAYFQEAGRAGRDGESAWAVLLYDSKDITILQEKLDKSFPEISYIKTIYQAIGNYFQVAVGAGMGTADFDLQAFCAQYKLDMFSAHSALKVLEESNYIYLSEAIYIPSRLQIQVQREELYEYLLKNEGMADILRALLRIYQGVHDQMVNIDEYKLAKAISVDRDELVRQLTWLHKHDMIHYEPSKDKPQISFIQERFGRDALQIDYQWYKQRKQWRQEMLDAVSKYLQSRNCRSRLLLAYFGEEAEKDCGVCDHCRHMERRKKWEEDLPGVRSRLMELLTEKPIPPEQIMTHFKRSEWPVVTFALQEMADEELIIKWQDSYALNTDE